MEKELSSVSSSTIGTRISEIADEVGGKKRLANMAGVSESQLHRYIADASQPTIEPAVSIAKVGGVNLLWLATGDGPKYPDEIVEQAHQHQVAEGICGAYKANNDFLSEFALVPGYSVQVSAGWGSEGSDEAEPSRHLAFRKRWLKWRGFSEKDLVVVWAKGDSMEPIISNNNTLLINMQRTELTDGNIFVIRNENQLWVKRVQVMPNAWRLLSDNKLYDPIEVPMDEQNNFQVVGQVVHIAKDIGN
jgi:phage repressor protein C with HTH and peptisase S24 domain